jgi:hypothetical protein
MESLEAKLNQLKTAWEEFTMGILNSELFKAGVDILTVFLNTINKATSALSGWGGSIVKIVSIFSMFKLGAKVFEQFKPQIDKALLGIADKFFERGKLAGSNFAKAAKQGAEEEGQKTNAQINKAANKAEPPKEKKEGLVRRAANAFGITDIAESSQKRAEARKEISTAHEGLIGKQGDLAKKRAEIAELEGKAERER